MILTPQLRQRIEMLQMTTVELAELVEQEMVTNPILEEVQPGDEVQEVSDSILDQNSDGYDAEFENGNDATSDRMIEIGQADNEFERFDLDAPSENGFDGISSNEGGEEVHTEPSDSFDEIDYGREFQDYLDPGYKTQEIEYKEDAPSFEQFLTHAPNLGEHLEWQLTLMSVDAGVEGAVLQIIGNLDEDGRLTLPLEEIAALSGCSLETATKAHELVLALEQAGSDGLYLGDAHPLAGGRPVLFGVAVYYLIPGEVRDVRGGLEHLPSEGLGVEVEELFEHLDDLAVAVGGGR